MEKLIRQHGFMKELGRIGLIGKEDGRIPQREMINNWTLAFYVDDEGQRHMLELKE